MEINHDCDSVRTTDLICTKRRRSLALQKCYLLNQKGWSSSKSHQQQGTTVTWWANLNFDTLKEIFSRVPVHDLLLNVSSVCSSWRMACWDFLFCSHNVLNLSITGIGSDMTLFSDMASAPTLSLSTAMLRDGVCFGDPKSAEIYDKMAVELKELLWSVMEGHQDYRQGWALSIKTIIVPYDLKISDADLLYISERTPSLERLLLLGISEITSIGFGKAIQNWKCMKEIHLGGLTDDKYVQFLKMLGKHSQELESLHIHQRNFILEKQSALVIAENLPKLKTLGFDFGYVYSCAIVIFFQMCLQMQVTFNGCKLMQHSYRPQSSSKIFRDCHRWFSLSWVVDAEGFAIWRVKPTQLDPDIPFEFDYWMFNREGCPQRLSPGNQPSPSKRKIPVWLDLLTDSMDARVDAYSRLEPSVKDQLAACMKARVDAYSLVVVEPWVKSRD